MKSILLAVMIVLCSTLQGLAGETNWIERRLGDLGVVLPGSGGWELEQRDGGEGWKARRLQNTGSGDPRLLHMIVFDSQRVPEIFHDWLPAEVATDYLMFEVESMRGESDKGRYTLLELDVAQVVRDDKTLHVLRSVKDYIEPWHPLLRLEASELYLVFLPDFSDTLTFYNIMISAHCFYETCTIDDLDLSEMYPVLDHLRDYSGTTN